METDKEILGLSTRPIDLLGVVFSFLLLSFMDVAVLAMLGLIAKMLATSQELLKLDIAGYALTVSLTALCWYCALLSVVKLIAGFFANLMIFRYSEMRQKIIKDEFVRQYLEATDLYAANVEKGMFISVIANFANTYVQKKILTSIRLLADLFVMSALGAYFAYQFGFSVVVFFAVLVTVLTGLIAALERSFASLGDNINQSVHQVIQNGEAIFDIVDEARAHRSTHIFSQRFAQATHRYGHLASYFQTFTAIPKYALEFVTVLAVVAFISFSGQLVGEIDMSRTAEFSATIIFIMIRSLPFLTNAITWRMNFQVGIKAEEQLRDALRTFWENPLKKPANADNDGQKIRLEKIVCGPFGADNPVSLDFEQGKKYRLLGESGSGKSTLIKLVAGIIAPAAGRVSWPQWNGKNASIAYVGQRPVFFPGTLLENLTLLGGNISEDIFQEMVADLGLGSWVKRNQITLETDLNVNNFQGSGGEFQRLSIMRALVSDADIYLLDEVTSALDRNNERLVLESMFDKYLKSKTVIVISHGDLPVALFDRLDDLTKR